MCGIAHLDFKYQQNKLALESWSTERKKNAIKILFMLMPPSRLQCDAVVCRRAVGTDEEGGESRVEKEQLVGYFYDTFFCLFSSPKCRSY